MVISPQKQHPPPLEHPTPIERPIKAMSHEEHKILYNNDEIKVLINEYIEDSLKSGF